MFNPYNNKFYITGSHGGTLINRGKMFFATTVTAERAIDRHIKEQEAS